MSQMNKGVPNPKAGSGQPFKPGLSPQGKAKAEIANQQGKIQRGMAQLQKGGPDNALMGHMNVESGTSGVAKGQAALAAAKLAKPTGPTMGARTGTGSAPTQLGKASIKTAALGPQELGAKKLTTQSVKLGAQELGAKKLAPPRPSTPTPMGKPGMNPKK